MTTPTLSRSFPSGMHQIQPCLSPPRYTIWMSPRQRPFEDGPLPVAAAQRRPLELLVGRLGAETVRHEGVATAGVDDEAGTVLRLPVGPDGGDSAASSSPNSTSVTFVFSFTVAPSEAE